MALVTVDSGLAVCGILADELGHKRMTEVLNFAVVGGVNLNKTGMSWVCLGCLRVEGLRQLS
jgi:hypothetical protein